MRAYRHSKLDGKSTPCVFLGYPTNQDGYICYDPQNGKSYISRDVVFIETDFSLNLLLHEGQDEVVTGERKTFGSCIPCLNNKSNEEGPGTHTGWTGSISSEEASPNDNEAAESTSPPALPDEPSQSSLPDADLANKLPEVISDLLGSNLIQSMSDDGDGEVRDEQRNTRENTS